MKKQSTPLFLKDTDLAARWGVHRVTAWDWARQGRIPAPIKLSDRCTRWRLADIESWEAEHAGSGQ